MKTLPCLLLLFLTIFGTKLHGKFDMPIIIGFLFLVLSLLKGRNSYPLSLVPYTVFLWIISLYALLISIIYGGNEIIFALKFIRTLLLLFLLYYVWIEIKVKISYDEFCRYFVVMTAIHSVVILSAIIFPDFRHGLYGITGYIPRGPEWSRSPGLTISFNATAIVHVLGFWLLISKRDWIGWRRLCLGSLILLSLIFLGRTISFLGLSLISIFMVFRLSPLKLMINGTGIGIVFITLSQLSSIGYSPATTEGQLFANFRHFIDPLISTDEKIKISNYYSNNLDSHIYFSDRWEVILFGDSYAGHMGILAHKDEGETNSDLGIINSINANGVVITVFIYAFYLTLVWQCRHNDWPTVAMVAFLTMALSLKETGLFTSHATPLLFFLFFYQVLGDQKLPRQNGRRHRGVSRIA